VREHSYLATVSYALHRVEAFNNVIHYQLSDNPQLIYALIRSHRRFESLANFTLKSAVEEIRRVRAERRSSSLPPAATTEAETDNTKPELKHTLSSLSLLSIGEEKSTVEDEADPVRLSEKARGKMRERDPSMDEDQAGDPGAPGPYRSRSGFTPTENCACFGNLTLTDITEKGSLLGASTFHSTPS
jgi:hypothetical protein